MEIGDYLKGELLRGNVVLFLGAGASVGAMHPEGRQIPRGKELAELIASRFLGGKHTEKGLATVCEYAASVAGLVTVQTYIRDLFEPLSPAGFHLVLPTFCWRAIFTTNFDEVIERAYRDQDARVQRLRPFLRDTDRVDDVARSTDDVILYKLHGSISLVSDPEFPLILTREQYVSAPKGRRRLFNTLFDLGHERPIVFIGHELEDYDIRAVVAELEEQRGSRPRYYLVKPGVDEIQRQYWAGRNVETIDATFEGFLGELDKLVPAKVRPILQLAKFEHPIERFFIRDEAMPQVCIDFLKNEVQYVDEGIPAPSATPDEFYRGTDLGWFGIVNALDVRRSLHDAMLGTVFLVSEQDRPSAIELFVVLAEAGAGKTTFLRRLAYEAATEWDAVCLFLAEEGRVDAEALLELFRLTERRIYLFVDDAADRQGELARLMRSIRRNGHHITVVAAERKNEWNMVGDELKAYVTNEFPLHYLSENETRTLVEKLAEHDSLGHLAELTFGEQLAELEHRSGRQLLVALYEATHGKSFEEIIEDEYRAIRPREAQDIYLAVCILNRLGAPVRAGVIYRVFGVPFPEFRERFFEPLERVVRTREYGPTGDMAYVARHPYIAEIVFERVLSNADERFNAYASILDGLNITYQSDLYSFKKMTKGKTVLELFPDHAAAEELYKIAQRVAPEDANLVQQHAIYEMSRPNGNLEVAYDLLKEASARKPSDGTITHSIAVLARQRALQATHPAEREHYRREAESLCHDLLRRSHDPQYPRHTLVELAIDELKELLDAGSASDEDVQRAVQEVESHLAVGLRESPENSVLLTSDATLQAVLQRDERAISALRRAFEANRRNTGVAIRLARAFRDGGQPEDGISVLRNAVDAQRSNQRLRFELAMHLRDSGEPNVETVLYHLQRSFAPGDSHYEAQFWYARFLYERGRTEDIIAATELFRSLIVAPIPREVRTRVRDRIRIDGKLAEFEGVLRTKDDGFGFIERSGAGGDVYVSAESVGEATWNELGKGMRVRFNMGLNFGGPVALNVSRVG